MRTRQEILNANYRKALEFGKALAALKLSERFGKVRGDFLIQQKPLTPKDLEEVYYLSEGASHDHQ